MEQYRWSICEPDNPAVIEKGLISKEYILATFEQFPWIDLLRKMSGMKESDICFSPSLEFQNLATKQGVVFSIVGDDVVNHEFYIFYKRNKIVKGFLGLSAKKAEGFVSDITGQTKEDAVKFLLAFLNNDTDYMEAKMKK